MKLQLEILLLLFALMAGVFSASACMAGEIPAASSSPKDLALAEAVLLALRNSVTVKSAYMDRIAQRYDLEVAEDKFTPQINIATDTRYNEDGSGFTTISSAGGNLSVSVTNLIPTGGRISFGWQNSVSRTDAATPYYSYFSSWNVQFVQPLLKGAGPGITRASVDIARLQEQINILNLKATLIDVVTSVITAYRALSQADRQAQIAQHALARAKDLARTSRMLIETGRMSELDLVQAEAVIANRELAMVAARNAREAARLRLITLLNINKSTRINPTEPLEIVPAELDLPALLQTALENRPDYQQALLGLELARIGVDVAHNNRLWELNLEGQYDLSASGEKYGYIAEQLGQLDDGRWTVGLTLNIPIGDLSRYQQVLQSKVNARKQRINLQQLVETIEIEVEDAIRDTEAKRLQVDLARQARALAERKLQIEQERLRGGRSTNFQLVQHEGDLVKAQNNELGAIVAYLNALTLLDLRLGTTLDTWKIELKREDTSWQWDAPEQHEAGALWHRDMG